ncbi:MAG: ammonium transporter [Dehalococcoidia bacterium]|nr:ammonium transporter [Dehalococcoidia bacterium]
MLTSSALVLFMTPGLALFYGGMVRSKNVLNMLMKNFISMGVITIVWVVIGYSLAFGGDGPFIGTLEHVGLAGLIGSGNTVHGAAGVPDSLIMVFQLMFAIITPALIAGAVAERIKFSAWVIFIAVWSIVVYSPMAHWVWDFTATPQGITGGFIAAKVGAVDFAGGLVVHINAGAAALALVLALGPRIGWRQSIIRPHNLPLTLLGTGILWFGWFGFNSGSALGSNELAAWAFVNTHIAAAVAASVWALVERMKTGSATTLGVASGAVAGLVAITPAAGFVAPMGAVAIGVAAGGICYLALQIKFMFNFDDSLDVVAVHLVGGILGSLLLGLLAVSAVNPAAAIDGSVAQFGKQAMAVGIALVYSFVLSYGIAMALKMTIGLRVTEDEERRGLDISLHDEQAYAFAE